MVSKKSNDFYGKTQILRSELIKTGVVTEMAESGGKVTELWSNNGGFDWKGKDPNFEAHFATLTVAPQYGKTVGWQFVAGRDFSEELATDSSGFVINETAAKYMGLENPVGEMVRWTNKWYGVDKTFIILGVIKDMVMGSPFEPIKPSIFFLQGNSGWINIKIKPTVSAGEALPKIEAVFKKIIPTAPFDYQFADDEYAKKFAAEERIGKLATFFATLAIFISCLGLFGLASFMAEQRTKEIGVRKVLGASIMDLWLLLSKDFVRLVLISFIVAVPIAWYAMNTWLENFAYRIAISWWIFALTGVGAMFIALFTVSWQSVKAALVNPVKSLRNE
jgi:ABC-type antimicrobial peptide transport system permease subunit